MENIKEIATLLGEVQMLGYLVNEHTKHAVFIDFSGHVKSLRIRIASSKENFIEDLTVDEFYVEPERWGDPTQKLKLLKLRLRKILRDNKIPYNELNYSIREVRDYHLA